MAPQSVVLDGLRHFAGRVGDYPRRDVFSGPLGLLIREANQIVKPALYFDGVKEWWSKILNRWSCPSATPHCNCLSDNNSRWSQYCQKAVAAFFRSILWVWANDLGAKRCGRREPDHCDRLTSGRRKLGVAAVRRRRLQAMRNQDQTETANEAVLPSRATCFARSLRPSHRPSWSDNPQ